MLKLCNNHKQWWSSSTTCAMSDYDGHVMKKCGEFKTLDSKHSVISLSCISECVVYFCDFYACVWFYMGILRVRLVLL